MKDMVRERLEKEELASLLQDWVEHYRPFSVNGKSANYTRPRRNQRLSAGHLHIRAGWLNDSCR